MDQMLMRSRMGGTSRPERPPVAESRLRKPAGGVRPQEPAGPPPGYADNGAYEKLRVQSAATIRATEIARQKIERDRQREELQQARERSLAESLERVKLRNQPAVQKTLQDQYSKWLPRNEQQPPAPPPGGAVDDPGSGPGADG